MPCACKTVDHCIVRGDTLSILLKINDCNPSITSIEGDITISVSEKASGNIVYTNTITTMAVSEILIEIPASVTDTWADCLYTMSVKYEDLTGRVMTLACINLKVGECK